MRTLDLALSLAAGGALAWLWLAFERWWLLRRLTLRDQARTARARQIVRRSLGLPEAGP